MLSGVKFIPRDQIDKGKDGNADDAIVEKRKSSGSGKREQSRRKKKGSSYTFSSDDDIERIKKSSRRKKKWYSSDEHSSEDSSDGDSGSDGSSGQEERRRKGRRKRKSRDPDRRRYSSEENSSSASGERKKSKDRVRKKDMGDDLSDDGRSAHSHMMNVDVTRKELGLDWMLRPAEKINNRMPAAAVDSQPEELPAEEIKKVNPRELNPYLKDNGTGYPDDSNEKRVGGSQLRSSAVVGDGGVSWRLKALKRAREQAAREGRKLDEVVEERWGSLGQLAVSAASHMAAPSRAHLHAIRDRKRGLTEDHQTTSGTQSERNTEKHAHRDYLKDVSAQHPQMRAPKVHESLSWGKRKSQNMSNEDAGLISAVASSINKFADDGSFMSKFVGQQIDKLGDSVGSHTSQEAVESKMASSEKSSPFGGSAVDKGTLSANQLAAKALQLRMKGRHEEAEKLMQEAESMKALQGHGENLSKPQKHGSSSRYVIPTVSGRREDDDADRQLAQKIVTNRKYSLSGQADDEYDFEDGPRRKSQKKAQIDRKTFGKNNLAKRILTQQERCSFCFENPNRPKHLVVSIANFTYLMLPRWQPVVPGHCCILPMQHESATRGVDNDVWEEIRNFKKCLIMMFAKQEKDVVFLETVMGLAQQRRHCLIECIPLPSETASGAPMYFKKAIDEAEEEWSQHNAKKLIDTSVKGLRGSIPKDFPYFHVEFGLNKGFVHVIDDEKQFKANFGLNVIRGMLEQQPEHMYRPPRYESVGAQKQAVADFARDWGPFDWTKQLEY